MQRLKAVKKMYTITTICFILVGLALSIWPQIGLNVICKIVGIFLLAHGLLRLIGYFSKDIFQLAFQFDLGLGIISLLVGMIMIFRSSAFIGVIVPCIGIFMIVDAALRIQTAIDAKKFGIARWWAIMAIAIAVSFAGIILFFIPFEAISVVTRIVGICLCCDGIMNLIVISNTLCTMTREKDIIDIY